MYFQRVRFAAEELKPVPKVETHDASVSTETPDYDKFLFVRMYTPINMKEEEMKCSVTFGKQFYKTKKLESSGKDIKSSLFALLIKCRNDSRIGN